MKLFLIIISFLCIINGCVGLQIDSYYSPSSSLGTPLPRTSSCSTYGVLPGAEWMVSEKPSTIKFKTNSFDLYVFTKCKYTNLAIGPIIPIFPFPYSSDSGDEGKDTVQVVLLFKMVKYQINLNLNNIILLYNNDKKIDPIKITDYSGKEIDHLYKLNIGEGNDIEDANFIRFYYKIDKDSNEFTLDINQIFVDSIQFKISEISFSLTSDTVLVGIH